MQLNLLIADDHPIFLKGLKEVIETDKSLKVISEATNGQNAVTAFQSDKRIDVVIMDIDMPRMNGLEAAEHILKIREVPIVILTMHKDKALFMKALEIGIQGYLLKENAVVNVIQAIYKVAEGSTYLSPELSIYLFKRNKPLAESDHFHMDMLTQAEKKILNLVAEYKSSKQIAEELFISEKTVFNHRMNICKKLNLSGKNSLLRFALENMGS